MVRNVVSLIQQDMKICLVCACLVSSNMDIKKYPNTNARQSQGIRLSYRRKSKRQNEQLPVSPFQRDTTQKSQYKRKYEVN